jgi:hypothetical protein
MYPYETNEKVFEHLPPQELSIAGFFCPELLQTDR